ncbi:cysteine-rich receptor-like protein kinase 10 isoform X3 [Magnolia sinica]|uniref:cysteine-rich receptor-like protein kinase 10 isoform X3 n=1 Tax=Magnolia sinica TaxID=86752 RepID=UPI0026594E8C|nr:cysteine-rich receptor-like protein kinase 10 isoform X3 [Magnolia sinica]
MKVPSSKTFDFLLLFSSLLSLYTPITADYIYHICSNSSNYPKNSTYHNNLNYLLPSLTTNGPITGFYNTTAGGTPNKVYGLVLCRGDTTHAECRSCINTASDDIEQRCVGKKQGIIWYDECLLRYSNVYFFSSLTLDKKVHLWNTMNVTDPDRFNVLLGKMMNNLSKRAAFDDRMFVTGEERLTSYQNIYGLVQCTKDISREDCDACLQSAVGDIPSCCSGKQGGRVLGFNCILRYEIYPFFHGASSTAATSPPPVDGLVNSTSTASTKGKRKKSLEKALAIAIPISVSLVIFFALCAYLLKRKTKETPEVQEEISNVESLLFDLDTVKAATGNFSNANKLGEGGFGPVYKGELLDGREIAVKRLSRNSGQGMDELKNEIVLIAKLQHRNLVRLVGCCLEGDEKLLVYEYVPNRSLDTFLFEIVSGRRNSSFYQLDSAQDLLGYTWRLWREGNAVALMDPSLGESCTRSDMLRCIHIGLLCVQENAADRPTMSAIVLMLNSYSTTLYTPAPPAFLGGKSYGGLDFPAKGLDAHGSESDRSTIECPHCSINEVTLSELEAR